MGPIPFLTRLAVRKLTTLRFPPRNSSAAGLCGHESLSIIFRFAQILLSVLDPGALVAKPHRLRLPQQSQVTQVTC
jgi:hypothetical protein